MAMLKRLYCFRCVSIQNHADKLCCQCAAKEREQLITDENKRHETYLSNLRLFQRD